MAKKSQQQDVLIVRDEKTGEVSVVAGLDAQGYPKRVPANEEQQQAFLKIDRGGDMLDNFFLNFFRQCKEPTRFGFYRIAAEQADKLLGVMKELLKEPEINKDLLAPHKIDTIAYQNKAEELNRKQDNSQSNNQDNEQINNQNQKDMNNQVETAPQSQNAEGQTPSAPDREKKNGYEPIDETKVDWQELENKWGIKRDKLEKSGDLNTMLHYGKSDLVPVQVKVGEEVFETAARLAFRTRQDGSVSLVPHFVQKTPDLTLEYKGYRFSDEDKANLKRTGNLGRIVNLIDQSTGKVVPSYVSIDRKTNELLDIAASKVHLRDTIGKTPLTETDKALLLTGAPLKNKEIELENGRKFTVTLQINADRRGVEFVPGTGWRTQQARQNTQEQSGEKTEQRNRWTTDEGKIRPIKKWKNIHFTDEQKKSYVEGKTVKLENVLDKQGQPCTMYLKFNAEKGRPFTHSKNPDTAQKVAPANESATQVAVNNEGKTNEATKNIKEPLQQGQVAPKNEQQQKKAKGIKL